jgi:hypothetical protein
LIFHACFYTICFEFSYTSWYFYAFSRTNLLTRCHSASSLFFAVFIFQKSYTGNILGITQNKSRTSYFYRSFAKTEDETEGGQGPASPPGGAAQWYVSNVSIIFDAPCLFLHHLLSVSLHFVAFLCIFRN